MYEELVKRLRYCVEDMLENAPTIIPAEEATT